MFIWSMCVQVVNMDENMDLVPRGTKMLPTGEADPRGPPTSLCASGRDRLAFLQARMTHAAGQQTNPAGAWNHPPLLVREPCTEPVLGN